jgi:hypothetical protein
MKGSTVNELDIIKVAQWLIATAAVATSTCFTVIRFAYSDFETQRTSDVYRGQIDKRLSEINAELVEINKKIDRALYKQQR